MKILHISTDTHGGAGIAATRLHQGLMEQGIDSRLLAIRTHSFENDIVQFVEGHFFRIWRKCTHRFERAVQYLLYQRPGHPAYASFPWIPSFVHRDLSSYSRDIVNLHWICGNFFSPFSLGRLKGPTVWTMHDTWPFTGGCHWLNGCNRFRQSCGQCPELCSRNQHDLSNLHWKLKRAAIVRLRPTIVSPSRAYAALAKQSGMLAGCRIEHIPNGVDTTVFKPIDKHFAREILGLPQDRYLILFGALGATSDHNKGYDLLWQALCTLSDEHLLRTSAVVFGSSRTAAAFPCPTHFLGLLHDQTSLALAYSAADIFVCPSRQENLPNTVMESLACGTPVVAFTVGGIPDMVEHLVHGYLARPYDPKDLSFGISFLLQNADQRRHMGQLARNKSEELFSLSIVAKQYASLYHEII